MNEELKIIIKAVTDEAKKSIQEVNKELEKTGVSAKDSSSKFGTAMKGFAKGAAMAITAIVAVGTAIVALGKKSLETIKSQSKLITAFQAVGASAKTAESTYKGFYRFLGDKDKATEASAHLAKIASNQQQLAEWTKISQGVYATFGDSLPIEGLTEAANETLRVGKVTGNLADALNWAGASEDELNAKLAATTSYEEREALLRQTLNNLYGEAAELYEKNNKELLDYNESQAKVDTALANAGAVITPLLTALNNLSATLLTALKPALEFIVPILTTVVNWFTKGVQAVTSFFTALTGKSKTVKTTANNIKESAKATSGLTSNLAGVEKQAEETAKALSAMGFDELNIVSTQKSSSGSGSGSGSSTPSYATGGGFNEITTSIEESEAETSKFAESVKKVFGKLAKALEPAKKAWTKTFSQLKDAWKKSIPDYISGVNSVKNSFMKFVSYIYGELHPALFNAFSENFAPMLGDIGGLAIEKTGKAFKELGKVIEDVVHTIIIPALDAFKTVVSDAYGMVGKTWKKDGTSIIDNLGKAFDNLGRLYKSVYEKVIKPILQGFISKFMEMWNSNIKPASQEITNYIADIYNDLLILYNKVIYPVANWLISVIAPIITKAVNYIFDVTNVAIVTITNILKGLTQVLKGVVSFITGIFTGDWKKAWQGIQDIFKGVMNSIQSVMDGAISLIKTQLGELPTFFSNVWSKIKSKVTDIGGKIGDAISGAMKKSFNAVINLIENRINDAIRLINGAIGLINKLPGVSVGNIGSLKLPRLAKGGIATTATTAVIGEAGKEAVLPLENNTQWMDKLADKIASKNNNPTKLVLKIGETEIGWAIIRAINGITNQTGRLQLSI